MMPGLAIADGGIDIGVGQDVDANGGNASATIDNAGTLNITAVASAHAATGTAAGLQARHGGSPTRRPGANAFINQGINQDVGAHALVTGTDTHGPGATAYNTAAQAGNALASLTNGGTINIEAVANATAYNTAFAAAYVGGGIHQFATAGDVTLGYGTGAASFGGNATAYMSNAADGVINVVANAHASTAPPMAAPPSPRQRSATGSRRPQSPMPATRSPAWRMTARSTSTPSLMRPATRRLTRKSTAALRNMPAPSREGEIGLACGASHRGRTLFDGHHRQQRHDRHRRDRRCPRDGHARRPGDGDRQCLRRHPASRSCDRRQCAGQPDRHRHHQHWRGCQCGGRQWRGVSQRLTSTATRFRSRRPRKAERPRSFCRRRRSTSTPRAYASGLTGASAQATINGGIAQYASATDGTGTQVANVSLVNDGAISVVAAATAHAPDVTIVSNGDFSSTHVVIPARHGDGACLPTASGRMPMRLSTPKALSSPALPGHTARSPGPTPTAGSPLPRRPRQQRFDHHWRGRPCLRRRRGCQRNRRLPASISRPMRERRHAPLTRPRPCRTPRFTAPSPSARSPRLTALNEVTANASVGIGIEQKRLCRRRLWHGRRQRVADQCRFDLGRREREWRFAGGPGIFGEPIPGNAKAICACRHRHLRRMRHANGIGLATQITGLLTTEGGTTSRSTSTPVRDPRNAVLNNTGSIAVTANASANGGGEATATADIDRGIEQDAERYGGYGGRRACARSPTAPMARWKCWPTPTRRAAPRAVAEVATGIVQNASAFVTEGDGPFGPANAVANLTNDGAITIGAVARASGRTLRRRLQSATMASVSTSGGGHSRHRFGQPHQQRQHHDRREARSRTPPTVRPTPKRTWTTAFSRRASGLMARSRRSATRLMPRLRSARRRTLPARPAATLMRTSTPAISQNAHATAVGGYATAELTNNGAISIGANANAFGGRDGSARRLRRRSAPASTSTRRLTAARRSTWSTTAR